ncbi:MAG TPA: DUF4468 domain-containing protein [Prolixibacteraceae bacterium]|nr:DUF4468 domain-containing protein [Prolixibacteraceae bacterium]
MKKIILLLAFIPIISFSQTKKTKVLLSEIEGQWKLDENNCLFYQEIVELPGLDKSSLFQRAENYFIYTYSSGKDVIQTKDKETGIIIGKGYWYDLFTGVSIGSFNYSASHILRIDAKDGKARITLTVKDYHIHWEGDNMVRDYDNPINSIYPINYESSVKNWDAKVFYSIHYKCKKIIEELSRNLKDDAVKSAGSDNW